MHSFEVQSNERACRKIGRIGLEQVNGILLPLDIALVFLNKILLLVTYIDLMFWSFDYCTTFIEN